MDGVNAEAPLQRGDVIVAVGNQRLASLEDFNRLVGQAGPDSSIAVLVRRGAASLYVPLKVGPR